jgi:hypothetical protein
MLFILCLEQLKNWPETFDVPDFIRSFNDSEREEGFLHLGSLVDDFIGFGHLSELMVQGID